MPLPAVYNKNNAPDSGVRLERVTLKDVADIHIEIVNQKFKSSEEGIDYSISKMKEVIKSKEKITIGGSNGYEAIGTVCTANCNDPSKSLYFPFSIMYVSDHGIIFKMKYSEGNLDVGWKEKREDWKYYNEYKDIISTFTFSPININKTN